MKYVIQLAHGFARFDDEGDPLGAPVVRVVTKHEATRFTDKAEARMAARYCSGPTQILGVMI